MQSADKLYQHVINWHLLKHNFSGSNNPNSESEKLLLKLTTEILLPVAQQLGDLTVSYGFTSAELSRYIQRQSPAGTAPSLDQHACSEVNTRGSSICTRSGAACDFIVQGYERSMHDVALYICQNLPFDKLYFYGRNRPIHISVSDEPLRHLQLMQQSTNGRRYPGKRAFGDQAIVLAKEL